MRAHQRTYPKASAIIPAKAERKITSSTLSIHAPCGPRSKGLDAILTPPPRRVALTATVEGQ